jgi:hypothetical protein
MNMNAITMQLPTTEPVNTAQLNVGDRVFTHGEVFELIGLYTAPTAAVRGFYTRLVATFWQEMPRHWAQDWHIQGNELATWARVVQP